MLFSAELCGARLLEDSSSAGANVWHKSSIPGPELQLFNYTAGHGEVLKPGGIGSGQ
jgi:hypothetical protein